MLDENRLLKVWIEVERLKLTVPPNCVFAIEWESGAWTVGYKSNVTFERAGAVEIWKDWGRSIEFHNAVYLFMEAIGVKD